MFVQAGEEVLQEGGISSNRAVGGEVGSEREELEEANEAGGMATLTEVATDEKTTARHAVHATRHARCKMR